MVKVYFETTNRLGVSTYAEVVAVFQDEELHSECLGVLEAIAKKRGFDLVTESIVDEVHLSDL